MSSLYPALPPPSNVLHVKDFNKLLLEMRNTGFQPDPFLEAQHTDISTVDAFLKTPTEQVQDYIQTEIRRFERMEEFEQPNQLSVEILRESGIPKFQELEAQQTTDLECLRRPRKESKEFMKKRWKELNFLTEDMWKQPSTTEDPTPQLVQSDEVVLGVALYHPKSHTRTQEFLVLGSQCLTQLRDALYCLNDHIFEGPHIKSGYFFIENVFYNDMRDPSAIDYSQPVIEWSNSRRLSVLSSSTSPSSSSSSTSNTGAAIFMEPFQSKRMEETSFADLTLRIGVPYLYVHQGNCEHRLVFTEVRGLQTVDEKGEASDPHLDPVDIRQYPRLTFQSKYRRRKCRICKINQAKYIVVNDRLAPEPHCLYCDLCYRIFHYDAQGKLIYDDFEVYPYFHSNETPQSSVLPASSHPQQNAIPTT